MDRGSARKKDERAANRASASEAVLLTPPCDTPAVRSAWHHDQKVKRDDQRPAGAVQGDGHLAALSWRYDSGLVANAIGDVLDLLSLTPAQLAAAGVACGGRARDRDGRSHGAARREAFPQAGWWSQRPAPATP